MALGLVAALSHCDGGADSPTGAQRDICNLGSGKAIAKLDQGAFDDVSLLRFGTRLFAAWSEASGSFVRELDERGAPRAAAVRVGERCAGGIDLAGSAAAGRLWLVCLRPGEGAEATGLSPDGLGKTAQLELGPAGRDSHGISAVAHGPVLHAAYHDGTPGAYAVVVVSNAGDAEKESRTQLSDPAYAATSPSLAWDGEHWVATWAEMRFGEGADSATRLLLQREGEPVRNLGETPIDRPDARLVLTEDGAFLGFRSRRKKDRHPQLYLLPLDADLTPKAQVPLRVGRANTLAAPVLQQCGSQRFAHMSRLYGGERYVALYPLDAQLRSLGGGYQYYENGHDYELLDAACATRGPVVLTAERPKRSGASARLTAALLECPGVIEKSGCSHPCVSR